MEKIYIRRAKEEDLPVVNKLLYQVEDLHRLGRPDLFKPGQKKYTDCQLLEIFLSDRTPVFVAVERLAPAARHEGESARESCREGVCDIERGAVACGTVNAGAAAGEKVLGYVFCIVQETKGENAVFDHKTLYIDDLCVDEDARGKGVGRILYDYAVSYAKSIGCHNLTLHVWEKNPGARAFYEKMGMGVQQTTMEVVLKP